VSIALFKEAVETARRLTGLNDLADVTLLKFYGSDSLPKPQGMLTSASKGFWKALNSKKKKGLWSSFTGTTAAGGEQHVEELFHRAVGRDDGFHTILRGPNDSTGPFPGGVSIIFLDKFAHLCSRCSRFMFKTSSMNHQMYIMAMADAY
jgi:hypothetical protein